MRKNKLTKRLLLILLITFPASILLGFIPLSAAQGEIPIQEDEHRWHWDSDIAVGTIIMFEEETQVATMNGTVMVSYKMLKIFNVSNILNTTRDNNTYPESDYYGNASLILGTELYYNCTSMEYVEYNMTELTGGMSPQELPLSMFGYNNTPGYEGEHYIGMLRSITPLFLPINETDLGPNIPFMAQVMNETSIDMYAQKGFINRFDQDFSTASKLSLLNSTDNYYLNATYYDNGTMENMDASYLMFMGDKEMGHITTKVTRVFDNNIIDEVVWDDDVQVGKSLYYGNNGMREWDGNETTLSNITWGYDEIKLDIIEISNITAPIMTFNMMYFQCFQQVLVNVSFWNATLEEYVPMDDDHDPIIFGMANELLPINLAIVMGEGDDDKIKLGPLITANISIINVNSDYNISVGSHPDSGMWHDGIIEIQNSDGSSNGTYYKIREVNDHGTYIDIVVEDWDNPPSLYNFVGMDFSIYEDSYDDDDGGPRFVVVPKNTNPEDFEVLFFDAMLMQMGMDGVFVSPDGITVFNNSMNQREMRQQYNLETGLMEWMYSTMDNGDVTSVMFRKNMTITTGAGYHSEELYSNLDGLGNAKVYVEYTADDDIELYWTVLPINPIPIDFNSELDTMPFYLDVYVNDSASIHDVNLTIIYDSSKLGAFDESNLGAYGFLFEDEMWSLAPEDYTEIIASTDTLKVQLPDGTLSSEIVSYFALGAGAEWTWGVKEGDIFMSLLRGNVDNGTAILPFNDFSILNITGIDWGIIDFVGPQIYQILNATKMDPDGYGGLTPSPMGEYALGMIGVNDTAPPRLRLAMDPQFCLGIPFIVPLQWGNLNLTAVGRALYDTFYSIVGSGMGMPDWDIIIADEGSNNLYFGNSVDGYYMNLTYFDNGAIKEFDVYSTFNLEGGVSTIDIWGTAKTDTDTTSDTTWGVNVGDTLYFGDIHHKYKTQISSIEIELLNLKEEGLNWYDTYMNFSIVNVTTSEWDNNTATWVSMSGTYTIAVANDYFLCSLKRDIPLLLPTGVTGADVYDFFGPFMGFMGLDGYIEIGADYLLLDSSYSDAFLEWYFDSTTGVTELLVGEVSFGSSTSLDFFVRYIMENASVGPGTYNYTATNPSLPGYQVDIGLETSGGQVDLLYTIIEVNPSATISQEGEALFYGNIFITNCINVDSLLVTYTFDTGTYDPSRDFTKFHFYRLEVDPDDEDDHGEWIEVTIEDLQDFNLTLTPTSFSFNLTRLMLEQESTYFDLIFGISYEESTEDLIVPGYDILFLLAAISMISVITVFYKRRKNLLK